MNVNDILSIETYYLIGDIDDKRGKEFYSPSQVQKEIYNTKNFSISLLKKNIAEFRFNGFWKNLAIYPNEFQILINNIDVDKYFEKTDEGRKYSLDINAKIENVLTPIRLLADSIIISKTNLYITDFVNEEINDQSIWPIDIFLFWQLVNFSGLINRNDTIQFDNKEISEIDHYMSVYANDLVQTFEQFNFKYINDKEYISENYVTSLHPLNPILFGNDLFLKEYKEMNEIKYKLIWSTTNAYRKFVFRKNLEWKFPINNDVIMTKHLYDTWSYDHYHIFNNNNELYKYYIYCLYRSWNSYLKLAGKIISGERRFYYGLITNYEELIKKEDESIAQNSEFILKIKIITFLTGLPPFKTFTNMPFIEFFSYINQLIDAHINVFHRLIILNEVELSKFYLNDKLYDFIINSSISDSILINNIEVINYVDIIEKNFIKQKPNNDYNIPVKYVGMIDYAKCVKNRALILNNISKININYNIDIETILKQINIPLVPHIMVKTDINTNDCIKFIRDTFWLRQINRVSFEKSIKPMTIISQFSRNVIENNFNDDINLLVFVYCFNQTPNYQISKATNSIRLLSRIKENIELSEFEYVNSSTLKLLSMFMEKLFDAGEKSWKLLTEELNIAVLGAVNEPLINILSKLSKKIWNITGYGDEAFNPSNRMNVLNSVISKNFDIIISDIDMINLETSDEIADKAFNLINMVNNYFSMFAIIKMNYPLTAIYDIINSKFEMIKSCTYDIAINRHSPFASYEHFLISTGIYTTSGNVINIDQVKTYEQLVFKNIDNNKELKMTQIEDINKYLNIKYQFTQNSLDEIVGKFINGVVNLKNAVTSISMVASISDEVRYGKIDYDDKNSEIRVSGFMSIKRLLLTRFIGVIGTITNSYDINVINGGYKYDKLVNLRVISPAKSFTNAQRILLLKEIIQSKIRVDKILDIGCREYEGIIYTFGNENVKYIGYDMVNLMLSYDDRLDYFRFINKTVTIDDLINMTLKENSFILTINSIFMSYDNKEQFLIDLEKYISAIVQSIDNNRNNVFALSFYCIDPDEYQIYEEIGTLETISNEQHQIEYHFTLDKKNPVATISYNELIDLLNKYSLIRKVKFVQPNFYDIYYAGLAYGVMPSKNVYSALPLYSNSQLLLLINQ